MRFQVIRSSYFVIIFLIVLRLWYWQIFSSDDLIAKAEDQRLTSIQVQAARGSILFSDGTLLAGSIPKFLIFAQPKVVKNKVAVAKTLAEIISSANLGPSTDLDQVRNSSRRVEKEILDKLNQDLYWVSLGQRVDLETKQKIEKLSISGVGFDASFDRFYPEGSSSAHILGFVGSDVYGSQTGYFGLEGYYNGELKGKKGILTQERDALGLPILIGKFLTKQSKEGKTLKLNIDRSVQHIVEESLKRGLEKYGAKGAGALVMDPKTGAILAMASYPNYDPLRPNDYPKENYKNPLIADSYEPGSTFKVIVMSAALNEKVITPETVCDQCGGPVQLGGFTIRTWNNRYQDHLTATDTIVHSDNTGMVFVSKKLGIDKLYSYLKGFKIGETTDIDLQDEHTPTLRPREDWKDIDLATTSFGQGISITAIQLARAVGAIANGGRLMEPHIVKEVMGGGESFQIKPREIGRPISQETAQIITSMMVQSVDKGEAQFYKKFGEVEGYKIAGKTGTAQIPVAGHYDPNKTIASFVGFAPANDPKFVALVRFDQPTASIYGAETAAPTFFEIAKKLFDYYSIPPQ